MNYPQREAPTCRCEICGEKMKHLGSLPNTPSFPAAKVFRCYACNNVTSQQGETASDDIGGRYSPVNPAFTGSVEPSSWRR